MQVWGKQERVVPRNPPGMVAYYREIILAKEAQDALSRTATDGSGEKMVARCARPAANQRYGGPSISACMAICDMKTPPVT